LENVAEKKLLTSNILQTEIAKGIVKLFEAENSKAHFDGVDNAHATNSSRKSKQISLQITRWKLTSHCRNEGMPNAFFKWFEKIIYIRYSSSNE